MSRTQTPHLIAWTLEEHVMNGWVEAADDRLQLNENADGQLLNRPASAMFSRLRRQRVVTHRKTAAGERR